MATHSISGNIVTTSANVYIKAIGDYPQPSPKTTVSDGSGNYTFSGLSDGLYDVYTGSSYPGKKRIILSGSNVSDINFSA